MENSKKIRVVIAGDDPAIRALNKIMLKSFGCDVIGEAEDGNEAVELVLQERPDLIILDIVMPRKTGVEALEEIINQFPDAKVIMSSSLADEELADKCFDLGATAYLVKSTSTKEKKEIIKSVINEMS